MLYIYIYISTLSVYTPVLLYTWQSASCAWFLTLLLVSIQIASHLDPTAAQPLLL